MVGENLFDLVLIECGKYLVIVGDCVVCYMQCGGVFFVGGYEVFMLFGNIFMLNIMLDDEIGLGCWSFVDFWQVLYVGKGWYGEFLYLVFLYIFYIKVICDDVLVMFVYLKLLVLVYQLVKVLGLKFFYSVCSGLVVWCMLYFCEGVYQFDVLKLVEWNCGVYLVQGLGYCNECYVVCDVLGGVLDQLVLFGGQIFVQDWYVLDLSIQVYGGLYGWSWQDIVDLFKIGQLVKGSVFGLMVEVVLCSMQYMIDVDFVVVVSYLELFFVWVQLVVVVLVIDNIVLIKYGNEIYDYQCVVCYGKDGNGVLGVYLLFNGNFLVDEFIGINVVCVVLLGGFLLVMVGNLWLYLMLLFVQLLKDVDVVVVVSYICQVWGNYVGLVFECDVGKY